MILRLTITLLLILLGTGALTAGKWWHRRQVAGKTAVFDTTGRPTILYFHSDDCAVCPTQSRQLQTLQAETGYPLQVQKVDVQQQPDMARQYHVLTLPTTILLNAGGEVKEINYGLTTWPKLRLQLDSMIELRTD